MSKPVNMLQGTLDMVLLKMISMERLHGMAIRQRLQTFSASVLDVGDSALYPALHKLQAKGLLKAEWSITGSG
jgi:DNA-binding PadR family transcriptional regulator